MSVERKKREKMSTELTIGHPSRRRSHAYVVGALMPFVAGVVVGLAISTLAMVRPPRSQSITNIYISLGKGEVNPPVDERLARVQKLLEKLEPQLDPHDSHINTVLQFPGKLEVTKSHVLYSVIIPGTATGGEDYQDWNTEFDTIRLLNETWAGDIDSPDIAYFIQGGESAINNYNRLKSQDLPGNIHRLKSSNQTAELHVLRYLCEHRLNSYKWFFISNSNVYVKTHSFEDYLTEIDALSNHYGYLGKPIKRDPIGRICMSGPGSVLSQQAMKDVCHKLEDCNRLHYHTNYILGECIRRHIPHLQCNKEGEPHELFLRYFTAKGGRITEQRYRDILDKALTLYPVSDPKLMFAIHQLIVAERLSQSQYLLQAIKHSLDQISDLLPHINTHTKQDASKTIINRDNVMKWKLINSDLLMSEEERSPALRVPAVWTKELSILKENCLEHLTSWKEDGKGFSLKRILNSYYRVNPHVGIDYIINFEGRPAVVDKSAGDFSLPAKHFRVSLSRRFDILQVNPVQLRANGVEEIHVTIAVFMTVEYTKKFPHFMEMLKKILEEDQRINLIVVKVSSIDNQHVRQKSNSTSVVDPEFILNHYKKVYPQASFTIIQSPSPFTRDQGIAMVVKELQPNDIIFLADLDLEFDSAFLDRCRSIPLQGQQVYIPIYFSIADLSLSNFTKHQLISGPGIPLKHPGYWMLSSNGVTCLYAADLLGIVERHGAKGIANTLNVNDMYRTLIGEGYDVVKVTDKGLRLVYDRERGCSGMLGGGDGGSDDLTMCNGYGQSYTELYARIQLSIQLFQYHKEKATF